MKWKNVHFDLIGTDLPKSSDNFFFNHLKFYFNTMMVFFTNSY